MASTPSPTPHDLPQQRGDDGTPSSAEGPSALLHSMLRNKPADEGLILPNEPHATRWDTNLEHITLAEADWRHSGWRADRLRTWNGLLATNANPQRLKAFANCGSAAMVQVAFDQETGKPHYRLTCTHCHDRMCVPCATARAATVAGNLYAATHDREVRFVTLTLKCQSVPLVAQVDRLYRSFAALRRRKFWKANVAGGAACCEVKIGANSGAWHVHLHCLVQTRWLAQRELSAEWHAVTGDSYIVDVRPIDRDGQRIRYVAKYAAKGCGPDVIRDPDRLQEFLLAMKGRRLCLTFGTWRGIPLEQREPDQADWQPLMRLSELIARAAAGDDEARVILRKLEHPASDSTPVQEDPQLFFGVDSS